jgi:hypothetical protein
MGMIIHLDEALAQAKRRRAREEHDRAELNDRPQDSGEALVRYHILLAQIKETLARG